jgi:hypothetical protein
MYKLKNICRIIFTFIALLVLSRSTSLSQSERTLNSIFLEVGGSGFGYVSFNYDRLISNSFSIRIGYSHTQFAFPIDITTNSFPLLVNYLAGENNSRFEAGIGIAYVNLSASGKLFSSSIDFKTNTLLLATALGYRYQPKDGGLLFRIDLTPFYGYGEVLFMYGISVGYTF